MISSKGLAAIANKQAVNRLSAPDRDREPGRPDGAQRLMRSSGVVARSC